MLISGVVKENKSIILIASAAKELHANRGAGVGEVPLLIHNEDFIFQTFLVCIYLFFFLFFFFKLSDVATCLPISLCESLTQWQPDNVMESSLRGRVTLESIDRKL